jgi:dihydroorotase
MPLDHDPDCACAIHTLAAAAQRKTSRREFLCMGVAAVALGSAASAAQAATLFAPSTDPLPVRKPATPASTNINIGGPQTTTDAPLNALTFQIPRFPDVHTHLRQDEPLPTFIEQHLNMGNDILVAMPNTKPPVCRVTGPADAKSWSIESYIGMIRRAGGDRLRDLVVPLYITPDLTPHMIEAGAKSGLLRACKYYPPHGTTNADYSVPMDRLIGSGVFRALEDNDIILCVHGESANLRPEEFFDSKTNAESRFYQETMPRLADKHSNLRISCEHLTTAEAVSFVQQADEHVVGTITPHHLLYTAGHMLQRQDNDLYCMPVVKFAADRAALWAAVTDNDNGKFIAGTDNAPHSSVVKSTHCGCAAGVYVGGIAPQLYAEAFELAGLDLASTSNQAIFRRFMAENAWKFWRFTPTAQTVRLTKRPSQVNPLPLPNGQHINPLPIGIACEPDGQPAVIPWSVSLS